MKSKLIILLCVGLAFGCKKNTDSSSSDITENAQQVGDVMASVDESGGSSGGLASMQKDIKGTFDRLAPGEAPAPNAIAQILMPQAEAVSCAGYGYGTCSSNTITRNYNNCSLGLGVTASGTVTLTWGGTSSSCHMNATSDTITRVPNFTISGRRGATLAVTKSGSVGQRLTWLSGSTSSDKIFAFTSDGINRKFTTSSAQVLFDQTTTVSGTLTITGTDRTSRTLTTTNGAVVVHDNLNSVVCTYTPVNVTWTTASCNCPTQGSWTGSCDNGKSTTLSITGCGTATYTEGSTTQDVTFDRCVSN